MTKKTLNLSSRFSSEILNYLIQTMSHEQIEEIIDTKESFLDMVHQGERSLTMDHLIAIEEFLGKPLPVILLEARKKSVPQKLKNQYGELLEIFKESGNLRASIMKQNPTKKNK